MNVHVSGIRYRGGIRWYSIPPQPSVVSPVSAPPVGGPPVPPGGQDQYSGVKIKLKSRGYRPVDRGHDHFVSTVPVKRRCPGCRALTGTCLEGGIPVTIDWESITQADEVEVLLRGRWTFDQLPGRTLARRDAARISAGSLGLIFGEHQCP